MTSTDKEAEHFKKQLTSLTSGKPSLSKQKIEAIASVGLGCEANYKHVVMHLEKFIWEARSNYKMSGLYILDAILCESKHKFKGKDRFGGRFARNLLKTISNVLDSATDKNKVAKVVKLWEMKKLFQPAVLDPIFQKLKDLGINPITIDIKHTTSKRKRSNSSMSIDEEPSSSTAPSFTILKDSQISAILERENIINADFKNTNPQQFNSVLNFLSVKLTSNGSNGHEETCQHLLRDKVVRDEIQRIVGTTTTSPLPHERSKSEERRAKDRRGTGLPEDIQKNHVLVISRTVMIKKVGQTTREEQLEESLKEFGKIEKIEIIFQRNIAYVTFIDRKDCYRCMQHKRDIIFEKKPVTIEWAVAREIQKDNNLMSFWNREKGYGEIPYFSLPKEIDILFDGNLIEPSSLPYNLRSLYDQRGRLHFGLESAVQVPPPPPLQQTPPGGMFGNNSMRVTNQGLSFIPPPTMNPHMMVPQNMPPQMMTPQNMSSYLNNIQPPNIGAGQQFYFTPNQMALNVLAAQLHANRDQQHHGNGF
uniref:CID domain-containing protein n=1 Tax=Rhabditophanes sp. KR3021 TaxID=114890 RepID=A0AC35UAD5_9BILA